MKLKNLAFFGVMASILSVASAQAEGENYIASKGYVDSKVSTVSSGVTTALENYSTTEQMNSAIETAVSPKANSADVYSKTAADGKFADKTATETALDAKLDTTTAASTYATQTALTDGLALKADKSTTYTKDDVDTALANKANSADVYSKTDADALLDAKQNTLTFDTTPTANSTNPVTSGGVQAAITAATSDLATADNVYTKDAADGKFATQTALSDGLALKANSADVYSKTAADAAFDANGAATAAETAAKGYTDTKLADYTTTTDMNTALNAKANSADVYSKTDADALLDAKQNTLTFDATPTADSSNPVTSAGVKAAIDAAKAAAQTIAEATQNATTNQVVTGVTTENGSVKSVTSTLIGNNNVANDAAIAPAKLNLSQSTCDAGRTCLLTYDASGNYAATPITNDSDL